MPVPKLTCEMAAVAGGALMLKGEKESDLGFRRKFSRSKSIVKALVLQV